MEDRKQNMREINKSVKRCFVAKHLENQIHMTSIISLDWKTHPGSPNLIYLIWKSE